jgi:tetratricopeptide (TPR) repeat protein
MAETVAEFREHILAEELLAQQPEDLLRMLNCALIFELPVPSVALEAVCDPVPELHRHVQRAASLGLLEVSTIEPDTAPHYRVPRMLQPPLACPDDPEALYHTAAQSLYRLWWREAASSTEEQCREIHRLALCGKAENIAAEMANVLASRWVNQSRFRDAEQICKETLDITSDYRVFHTLARAERPLGEVDAALEHYQQALRLCAPEDEREKAAIIHNTANIYAQQGQVEQALTLHQQSLDIKERIGNVQGKAATLHQMAIIYAQQGQVEQALTLYQQSLDITERIGDVQGKAPTLAMMGHLLATQGDVVRGMDCLRASLVLLEQLKSPDAQTVRNIIARLDQRPQD